MSICSQLCYHSNTAVAKNKRKLLHYLNDNGDILLEQSYKILDKQIHMNEYCESDLTTCMFILELRNLIDDQYTLRDFEEIFIAQYMYAIMYGVMFCLMYMYAPWSCNALVFCTWSTNKYYY